MIEYVPIASGVAPTTRLLPDRAKEVALVPLKVRTPDQVAGTTVIRQIVVPAGRGAV